MKIIQFLKCLIIELLSELDEALAARAQFKAVEQAAHWGALDE